MNKNKLGILRVTIVAEFNIESIDVLGDLADTLADIKFDLEGQGTIKEYCEEFLSNKENE